MGRKETLVAPSSATDPVINARILVPEKRAGEPAARPHVSRDPLYETDRYRLVTPIAAGPDRIEAPTVRPVSE